MLMVTECLPAFLNQAQLVQVLLLNSQLVIQEMLQLVILRIVTFLQIVHHPLVVIPVIIPCQLVLSSVYIVIIDDYLLGLGSTTLVGFHMLLLLRP